MLTQTARILAVADIFEAMTASRPYRDGLPVAKALEALDMDAGSKLDSASVTALHSGSSWEQLSSTACPRRNRATLANEGAGLTRAPVVHQFFGDVEPEPGAADAPVLVGIETVELLEDSVLFAWGHARPVVGDDEPRRPIGGDGETDARSGSRFGP